MTAHDLAVPAGQPSLAPAQRRLRARSSVVWARRRHRHSALLLVAALAVAACSDQDPGLDPSLTPGGDDAPPATLGPCPPGGPDDTTPAAGCLDDDGTVLRPA